MLFRSDTAWTDLTIEKNTLMLFTERFSRDSEPLQLSVKFLSKDTDGAELSYDLENTVLHHRPLTCNFVENYRFQATDAGDGSIDLVHIQ